MKKNLLYLFAASLMTVTACDLDINDDPSYPESGTITADLMFPSVQNYIATVSCDNMFNYAGFFCQYFEQMPETNQFNDYCEQTITESSQVIDRAYSALYAGALTDIEDIRTKTDNTADLLALAAMRTFAFQLLVDNMSECPYTEALQGSANAQPAWDDGQTVYNGVLAELDAAVAAYEANPELMTVTDMMFDGDMDQWMGYINALRLRMYMRMYDADNSVRDKIVALVNENNFFTGDAMLDIYSDATDNRSPFYGSYYALGTGNHVAAYPIVSYMQFTNDPRIAYAFSVAVNSGEYVGQFPGAKADMKDWNVGANEGEWKNNDVSAVNYSLYNGTGASRPAYLFTQANLQFLIAEAKIRFMNDEAGAKTAYEAAIAADFAARGMSGQEAAFLSGANVNWDNAADKLHLIYMQKWVALFYMDNMEAWSEMRRTDVPELSTANAYDISQNSSIYTPGDLIEPYRNGLEAGGLLKRMFYPQSARNLNPNTPPMKTGSEPVWWDVN